MSAEIQIGTGVFWGEHQHSPDLNTPVDSVAAPVGRRSFSCFFKSALAPLRKFVYTTPTEPGCVICTSGHSDVTRLAKLVALLPVGRKVQLPALSAILNVKFKIISRDLNMLEHQLRLPIKRTHHGILLTEPVRLCKNCAGLGKQLRHSPKKPFWCLFRRNKASGNGELEYSSSPPPF
jgi:hypothetical protein